MNSSFESTSVNRTMETISHGRSSKIRSGYDSKQKWKLRGKLVGHLDSISCLFFSPLNLLASGSDDRTIKLWNVKSDNSVSTDTFLTLRAHRAPISSITGPSQYSSDNIKNRLYSADLDGNIIAWTIPSYGKKPFKQDEFKKMVTYNIWNYHKEPVWDL